MRRAGGCGPGGAPAGGTPGRRIGRKDGPVCVPFADGYLALAGVRAGFCHRSIWWAFDHALATVGAVAHSRHRWPRSAMTLTCGLTRRAGALPRSDQTEGPPRARMARPALPDGIRDTSTLATRARASTPPTRRYGIEREIRRRCGARPPPLCPAPPASTAARAARFVGRYRSGATAPRRLGAPNGASEDPSGRKESATP